MINWKNLSFIFIGFLGNHKISEFFFPLKFHAIFIKNANKKY